MFTLRKMEMNDLDLVLAWRNHPDVRKNMYTRHIISKDEHKKWFEKVQSDPSRRALICQDENATPVGFVGFSDIDLINKTAFWAYYSGDVSRRGIGTNMEYLALNYAFEDLRIEKLICEVLSFNQTVIDFHRKFGFQVEGIFRKHHCIDGVRVDVYRLAIFSADWMSFQKKYFTEKLSGKPTRYKFDVGDIYQKNFLISHDQIQAFGSLTGDVNPIHFDESVARKLGFKSAIAHGFLSASIFSRVFGMEFPGQETLYLSQTMEFFKPVYPDSLLIAKFKILSRVGRKITVSTTLEDQIGNILIAGEAKLLIRDFEGV